MKNRPRRMTVLSDQSIDCLAQKNPLISDMNEQRFSPAFYPPVISPKRHQIASDFLCGVEWYFKIPQEDIDRIWLNYLPIGNRRLATSGRYSHPISSQRPYQFITPIISKESAGDHLREVYKLFDRLQVPQCTRREYLKELFIIVICRVHRFIAELQTKGFIDGCKTLH